MNFRPKTYKNQEKSWTIFYGLCKGCGICIQKCPVKAILWDKNSFGVYSTPSVKVEIEKCIACKVCEVSCPDCAIRIEKK